MSPQSVMHAAAEKVCRFRSGLFPLSSSSGAALNFVLTVLAISGAASWRSPRTFLPAQAPGKSGAPRPIPRVKPSHRFRDPGHLAHHRLRRQKMSVGVLRIDFQALLERCLRILHLSALVVEDRSQVEIVFAAPSGFNSEALSNSTRASSTFPIFARAQSGSCCGPRRFKVQLDCLLVAFFGLFVFSRSRIGVGDAGDDDRHVAHFGHCERRFEMGNRFVIVFCCAERLPASK